MDLKLKDTKGQYLPTMFTLQEAAPSPSIFVLISRVAIKDFVWIVSFGFENGKGFLLFLILSIAIATFYINVTIENSPILIHLLDVSCG